MDSSFTNNLDKASRPTLPPLHYLNLPIPRISKGRARTASTINAPSNYLNETTHATRSSTTHSVSSSSTPTLSFPSSSFNTGSSSPNTSAPTSPTRAKGSFRLVPCEIEDAEAIVFVTESTDGSPGRGKALLLIGPAAQPYRQPSTRPEGSRVHPYKFAPAHNLTRR